MDIHKPKPWHGWREFVKEIGTIVIGVLIALGAEAGVEAMHWAERTQKTEAHLRAELANATVAAQVHIAQEPCEYAMLDRLQQVLLQPGDDWRPPFAIVGPDGVANAVLAAPIGGFQQQGWKNAQADGTANHLPQDQQMAFGEAYNLLATAQAVGEDEHSLGSELNSLAWPRRLDPASRTDYLRLVARLREDVRLMATSGRQILAQTKDVGVTPGKLEDYGPALAIYQGICRQFQAGKSVIVIRPPAMGA